MNPAERTLVSNMTLDDLEHVMDWAASEGWNPGLSDARAFIEADPGGFFVARLEGAPIAAISVVNHSDHFAFLGLYICKPEWRGKGIGFALWDLALTHAGGRTIGLDGVPDQQANYEASGFVHVSETTRFSGMVTQAGAPLPEATPEMVEKLTALEAKANGYKKRLFMAQWLRPLATRKTLVLEGGRGFATVRKCRNGAKIGPLVAKGIKDAKTLLSAAASVFEGPLIIDVSATQTRLADYCRSLGMTSDFSTARMYRGPAPAPGKLIHSAATMELG